MRGHEPPGDHEALPTLRHVRAILFGGDQRLLFKDSPSRFSARHTVDSTTRMLSMGISCLAVIPSRAATVSRKIRSSAAVSFTGPPFGPRHTR